MVDKEALVNSPIDRPESQERGLTVALSLHRISVWCPAFVFSIVGATIAWVHRFADYTYGEDESLLIFWGFVIVGSICKIGFLCCVPFLLRHVFLAMQGDARRALLCAASWSVASAILIALLTHFHDRFTEILNTDAVRFYPVSDPSPAIDGYYIGREAWLALWHSGQILAIEAGCELALIVLLVGFGYGLKNRGVDHVGLPKIVAACVALPVVCIAWPHMFGQVNWDYDIFIGAMLSGSLALDLMVPITVLDPSSQIAFPVFAAFTFSTYAALRLGLPRRAVE
jgi:hypothetical protein